MVWIREFPKDSQVLYQLSYGEDSLAGFEPATS